MIKYCLKKWDANKEYLEQKLKTDTSLNSCDYPYLVKLVVDNIFNIGDNYILWDSENITVVDNGDYQGTLLFLIPAKTYQPSEHEYLMTYAGYGSCSGCDTLLGIQEYGDKCPSDNQVRDYMTLCRDLVANTIKTYNSGWRYNKDFETVNEGDE